MFLKIHGFPEFSCKKFSLRPVNQIFLQDAGRHAGPIYPLVLPEQRPVLTLAKVGNA
jgi:hypothetical protein